jgi:hypothetical protein
MKRLVILMLFASIIVAGEELRRVDIDRRAKNNLVTLFEELPQEIEVFISSDSVYVIEAVYQEEKIVKRLSSAEYKGLILIIPAERVILEDAQLPYVIGQTIHGIGLYSWSFPLALGMGDSGDWESAAALGLLMPLLYSTGSYLATKDMRISGGAAYGSFLGAIEGACHGGLLFESERAIFPASLGENLLDFTLAQKVGLTSGMYQRKFNHCVYGYYHYGVLKALMHSGDWGSWDNEDEFLQVSTLLSLGEGYTSLFLSRNSEDLTLGDALFEFRAASMGAEALPLILMTYDLHREEASDPRIYAALSLAGHGAGYLLGHKLSRDYDLSGSGGVMIWMLPYLAHGATAALTFLGENEGLQRSYPAIFLTTDFLLTYVYYKAIAKKPLEMGQADTPNFNLALNPVGLICRDKNKTFENMPFLMFSYRF